ncbi:hypothetical protein H8S84_14885 [Pontibacter sp. SD6]|uniref:DUF922 domain-containing protein n=2 Tax=Pontibacter cellulosilyticus TaxID=1720253 RepID=A0A923N8F9_9BACT|nr:hypothetical protein [Pontibacter cellulosilyticus]
MWAAGPPVAGTEPIVLKAEPLPISPKEYYIAKVLDERPDKKAIAHLYAASVVATPVSKPIPVDLKGGAQAAVQDYLRKSLPYNTKLRPVVMRLKEFNVIESAPVKGRVEGRVVAHVIFGLQRDGEILPLIAHQGGIKYNRPASQQGVVEPALRQVLTESLRYFDTWINKEAGKHVLLARSLKVHFADHTAEAKDDTVFYSLKRPLNWGDFIASPTKESKYAAAVFSGFAYEGDNEVKDGVIHLNLKMKVFVVKSASWAKAAARDAYTLNHEQRHFDIVKLVAERFKQKLHPDSLTLADYNSIMQYKYIESYREMNRLQEQYDSETKHGTDTAAQQRWNQKIDAELRTFKVKQ